VDAVSSPMHTRAVNRNRRSTLLGFVVAAVGRASETYISRHINSLAPGLSTVCSLSPHPNPQWRSNAPVMELFCARSATVETLRRLVGAAAPLGLQRLDAMRLSLWLAKNQVKVVFCEYLPVALLAAPVCRRLRIPVVAHAHGYDITAYPRQPGWGERYRRQLPLLDDVVVVSSLMKEQVLRYGVTPERVHVIPCGTDVPRAADPLTDPHDKPVILVAVGRLVAKKGPLFLLESFRRIRSRVPATLLVIGDGPFREPMEQFIKATGLEDSVVLLGEVPHAEIRMHLRRATVFLQHSVTANDGDEEGLPVSILEAMSESVPVVATDHAAIRDAVHHEKTGMLVSPGDCAAMADSTVQLLTQPNLRVGMGAAARACVESSFSVENELRDLRSILGRHWRGIARDSVRQ
jgi:colanic acid/amylovoran biosynthesis glycosyltransferase